MSHKRRPGSSLKTSTKEVKKESVKTAVGSPQKPLELGKLKEMLKWYVKKKERQSEREKEEGKEGGKEARWELDKDWRLKAYRRNKEE